MRWWEIESSLAIVAKMENELLKDEAGDMIHNSDGDPQRNMIGALTSFILEHWCGGELQISNKHEIILMNIKCNKMSHYEDFRRDCIERIYEVKDRKNLLWKQIYLAALPSKFVHYLRQQDAIQFPFESFTRGEIYSIITKVLVNLCTSMKVNKYLQMM